MRDPHIHFLLPLLLVTGVPHVFSETPQRTGMDVRKVSSTGFPNAQTLQEIINQPGAVIDVPYGEYVLDVPLLIRSNVTVRFAPGTRVTAAPGAFRGIEDCLVVIAGVSNVVIEADQCTFQMRKNDYRDPKEYKPSEWRHVVTIRGSTNITIRGGRYESSGGDGIYIGPLVKDSEQTPCDYVNIVGVTCDDNHRQGVSVLATKNSVIADSIFSGTIGTSPQAGIDVEPEYGDSVDLVVRNCTSKGNRGAAFMVNLSKVSPAQSIRIVFENCDAVGVPADQLEFKIIGVFNERGRLESNLPVGAYLAWNGLVWIKRF